MNLMLSKGTLLGLKQFLIHKKVCKGKCSSMQFGYKDPETKENLLKLGTATERLAYKRVGDVLVHYLSAL